MWDSKPFACAVFPGKALHRNDVSGKALHRNDVSGKALHRNDVSGKALHRNDVSGKALHRNDVTGKRMVARLGGPAAGRRTQPCSARVPLGHPATHRAHGDCEQWLAAARIAEYLRPPRIGLHALASTDQPVRRGPRPAGVSAFWWPSCLVVRGGGSGRLVAGSGVVGSWQAFWPGGVGWCVL